MPPYFARSLDILTLPPLERFSKRTGEFFSMIQPLQRFTKASNKGTVYVYVYSQELLPAASG